MVFPIHTKETLLYFKLVRMRVQYKFLCSLLLAVQTVFISYSQDVGFSQFYDQPLLRNPALAGFFDGDMRFTASYRNQWQSVTTPYRTFGLGTEFKLPAHIVEYD